jgi:hypothetical protein
MDYQSFTISNWIVGVALILWSVVVGLAIVAFGQVLLAIREVAHNTRKEAGKGAHYNVLLIMAKINNLLGWIVLALGAAAGIYMLVAGHPIVIQWQTQGLISNPTL